MADKDPGSVKVSSLPFYRDAPRSEYTARPEEASVLRDGFRAAREGVTEVVEAGREARDAVNHVVDTGAAHSSSALYQVRVKMQFFFKRRYFLLNIFLLKYI